MKTVRTWWGRKFIDALEGFIDEGRLSRGRGYANNDRITQWAIDGGRITASIRGNVNPYFGVYQEPLYQTSIELKPIAPQDWRDVVAQFGYRAAFVARLLMNEMPDNIEEPFAELGLRLLPGSVNDMETTCSCPDYANPCKHVAGLDYFLAAKLDADPFLLFELRGLSRMDLLKQLCETPLGRALALAMSAEDEPVQPAESYFTRPIPREAPASMHPEGFWLAAQRLPAEIEPAIPPAVAALTIKKGGDYPGFWQRENSFIEAMEEVYQGLRKHSKNW
ncbi:MAG: SWIM zinc finger family protein [Candidatus Methylumidiphilus sp.]